MTLLEAVNMRRSRRKYLEASIEPALEQKLQNFAQEYSHKSQARIELVFNNGRAFNGLTKSYGLLSGVEHYAGLICKKGDVQAIERLGYYGELFMLQAVSLGLGTCWVEGSFSRAACPFEIGDDEALVCTITFGHCAEQENLRERFIQGITHRKSKKAEEMMHVEGEAPDWFMAGMRAVERAPSAVNKQPVRFTYKDGVVCAGLENSESWLDLGIAKLHFELGAGGGQWEFGDGAQYTHLRSVN